MEDLVDQTVGAAKHVKLEDVFNLLPDELIVSHIFDKICDAKSLCRISLVSKHFSSLVYQTKTISFKIPHEAPIMRQLVDHSPLFLLEKILNFITGPLTFAHALCHSITPQQSQSRPPTPASLEIEYRPPPPTAFEIEFLGFLAAKFIGKFTSLQSLHMEIDNSKMESSAFSVVKWKYDYKTNSIIILIAKSLHALRTATHDDENGDDYYNIDDFDALVETVSFTEISVLHRISVLEKLVCLLPKSLDKVVVTDTKKQGEFGFRGSDLDDLRNQNTEDSRNQNTEDSATGVNFRLWTAPLLKLPLSRSVMRMVSVYLYKDINNLKDDCLIVKEAFEGEEEVFVEALMEMLKKEVAMGEIVRPQDMIFHPTD
ncbi:hypothetical protein ACH5RR_015210 [Cinchona calisaya]|uniref:F-box domain-containing protein n=1 Tax=Cinchona calisaya TaxID=153742 RepID=A0ABD2ZSH0_9GENT